MNLKKSNRKIFIKARDSKSFSGSSKFDLGSPWKDKELEELIEASKNDVYFPVSCQEYADNGATQNGSYRVQPNTNISRKYVWHNLDSVLESGSPVTDQNGLSFDVKCKISLEVFQSIVSSTMELVRVYFIRHFLNQRISLQHRMKMMVVKKLAATKTM